MATTTVAAMKGEVVGETVAVTTIVATKESGRDGFGGGGPMIGIVKTHG